MSSKSIGDYTWRLRFLYRNRIPPCVSSADGEAPLMV